MHILVTRPELDAAETAAQLAALGLGVSVAPLLQVEFLDADVSLDGVQAIVATSRNALRALARSAQFEAAKALPIAVVGRASARQARELGWREVIAGDGGARELLPLVVARLMPDAGRVLYVSGEEVAFDLATALEAEGFTVTRQIVYRTADAAELPGDVVAGIRGGVIDATLMMSPRSARAFCRLCRQHQIETEAGALTMFCLSHGVAGELRPLVPRKVLVADRPSSEEVLALISQMASNPP